ncbi:MAG: NADH-quinone oxidoreductase subunit NuoH [Chloroflexota bacterium]
MFGYDPNAVIMCSDSFWCSITHPIIASLLIFFLVLTGFAYTTFLERKFIAFFQQRSGPNRVGPGGWLQPAADGLKLIFKEDIVPAEAYKAVYFLAPVLKTVPYLIVFAVMPWGPDVNIPWFNGEWYRVKLGIADVNVGVLWLLAITSLATYGVVLAGWSSNNKYAMLGGLRASAQMISYELSLGLGIAIPVMIVGSMSVQDIVQAQETAVPVLGWFVFQNPLAAAILGIALLAEVSRTPFDLPEAEQELTQGYMTEYSGMKFAIFMMAEYLGMIGVSMIWVTMYFGGWGVGGNIVGSMPLLGPVIMIGKIVAVLVFMVWIRATLPRFRYDRLMSFGWKVLLPLAFVAVGWTAVSLAVGDSFQSPVAYAISSVIFGVVLVGGAWLLFSAREDQEEVEVSLADDPMVTGERRGLIPLAVEILGTPISLLYDTFDKLNEKGKRDRAAIAAELREFSSTFGSQKKDDDEQLPPPEAEAPASGD